MKTSNPQWCTFSHVVFVIIILLSQHLVVQGSNDELKVIPDDFILSNNDHNLSNVNLSASQNLNEIYALENYDFATHLQKTHQQIQHSIYEEFVADFLTFFADIGAKFQKIETKMHPVSQVNGKKVNLGQNKTFMAEDGPISEACAIDMERMFFAIKNLKQKSSHWIIPCEC